MRISLIILTTVFISCQDTGKETVADETSSHKKSSLVDSTKFESDMLPGPPRIDSTRIRELKKNVNEKLDEYSGITWIRPKSAPRYRSANGIYCYFGMDGDRLLNLRLVIQYYSDDWLFIDTYRFLVDGQPFSFYPEDVKRDNGYGGYIWEWCDEPITRRYKDLLGALDTAKDAKIKFVGSDYVDEKVITKSQLKAVQDICRLYLAMGGEIK